MTKEWYCIKAKHKREHIAAEALRRFLTENDVFCPRIKYRKKTVRGTRWFHEAMFPAYLFARFQLSESKRLVLHSPGVTGIVHFNTHPASLEESVIENLRATVDDAETCTIDTSLKCGDSIEVLAGPLAGIRAVVSRVMTADQRIAILLELLGAPREIVLKSAQVHRV